MQLDAVEQVGATQLHHDARAGNFHVVIREQVCVISDAIARQCPTTGGCSLDELQRNCPDKTTGSFKRVYLSAELRRRQVDVLDQQEGGILSVWQRAGVSLLLDRVQNLQFGEQPRRLNHVNQVVLFDERQSDMSGDLSPIWCLERMKINITMVKWEIFGNSQN